MVPVPRKVSRLWGGGALLPGLWWLSGILVLRRYQLERYDLNITVGKGWKRISDLMGLFGHKTAPSKEEETNFQLEYYKGQERMAKLWVAYEEQADQLAEQEETITVLCDAFAVLDRQLGKEGGSVREILVRAGVVEEELVEVEKAISTGKGAR